jgi:hypothetical protein
MRYGLSLLVMLAWGLWFGGLMTLFVMVSHLFSVDRPTAVIAAPRLFLAFERYQLIVAAVALVTTVAWRLIEPRAVLTTLFIFFAVAAVGAIINASVITPRLEALRLAGQSSGPAFRALHGRSMVLFMCEAIALLIGGGFIVAGMAWWPRGTTRASAPASAPPASPVDPPLSP